MDRFYHLHPEQANDGSFTLKLPTMPPGKYKIFADIVRGTGFPETMVSEIDLPNVTGNHFPATIRGWMLQHSTLWPPPRMSRHWRMAVA